MNQNQNIGHVESSSMLHANPFVQEAVAPAPQASPLHVKFVEMPGQYGAQGAPVRHQEAGFYFRNVQQQGGDLRRHVKVPVTVLDNEYTKNEVRNGDIVENTYKLSDEYDVMVFFASREAFGVDAEFEMGYYLENLAIALEKVREQYPEERIIATYTTPGTYTAPDAVTARIRQDEAEELFMAHKMVPVHRMASADIPYSKQFQVRLEQALVVTKDTLVFQGSRDLEGGNIRYQAVGEALGKMLENAKPDRLVVGFSVGANLRAAEMAAQMGIPVTLVHDGSEPSQWTRGTLPARVEALLAQPGVTVVGEESYVQGKRGAILRELNRIATNNGAAKAVVETEVESEARFFTNARNFYPQVVSYLTARGDNVSDLLAKAQQAAEKAIKPSGNIPVSPLQPEALPF